MTISALLPVLPAVVAAASGCKCTGDRTSDPACCWTGHAFVPNDLEQTPLRGWRSWQAFAREVDQTIMEDTMRGLAKKRNLGGEFESLAAAGYTDVGLDGGYDMHGHGFGGSCHTKDGHMLVNETQFPSLKSMTDTAHALNLTASYYLNNDGCPGANETLVGPTYPTDAADAVAYGFDGVKFDTQRAGPSHNITLWAMALKEASDAAGRSQGMLIENCDDKNPTYLLDNPADCPYNHYRTGPDNSPSFFAGMHHVWHWATPYLAVKEPVPASRPGCFAYPDMLGIGAPVEGTVAWAQAQANGCANMTMDEERTLFATWAIISSPLILSIDVRNDAVVRKYWPIVTNRRALDINAAWAGSAGELLKESKVMTANQSIPDGASCETAERNPKVAQLPTWLAYVKPLPKGEVAALIVNLGETAADAADVSIFLEELLALSVPQQDDSSRPGSFAVTDVWSSRQVAPAVSAGKPWTPWVSGHDSSFVVFTPSNNSPGSLMV